MKPTEFITETSLIAQEADVMHQDHEVQMARADCYNAAKYAIELHRMLKDMSEAQGLDGWVSEKITLANDYLRTVAEYLRHEQSHNEDMMMFAEDAAEYALDAMLNEDAEQVEEAKHFRTAYGWAGGRNEKTGKTYKHPDQIKADREAKKAEKEKQAKNSVKESASAGGTGAASVAVSMSGPAGKPGTGKPKKIGNAAKMKKVQVGKGVY